MTGLSGREGRGRGAQGLFYTLALVIAVCLGSLVLVGAVTAETGEAPDCEEVSYVENDDGQFEIENVSQLQCIEDNGLDQDYVLVDDIDASETEEWNDGEGFDPIGDYDNNDDVEFTGTLDGANHTIEGLFIDRPDENWVGMFARAEGATIENVGLVDADVTGNEWVGSLAGSNAFGGKITESYATGNVTSDYNIVGGLVGQNTGATITNSHAAVTVSGDAWRAGGLVGRSWTGFSGQSATISESYATGNVTGQTNVGGLAGTNEGELSESYATGTVTGNDRVVGGLVGTNRGGGSVSDSYATGDVTGDDIAIGGLAGNNRGSSISRSYATGAVTGDSKVGGSVGRMQSIPSGDGRLSESYAAGNVTGTDDVGGLVGYSEGFVEDAYWDDEAATVIEDGEEVEGQSDGGTPLATAEMTGANAPENMDGFAFPDSEESTWHATDDYPVLAWANTDSYFGVTVTETNSPIDGGDILKVTAGVTNWGADGEQTVELLDVEDAQQDTKTVTLESGDSDEVTLAWETEVSDAGTGDVTVTSENDADSEDVTIETGIGSVTTTIDGDEAPTVVTGETVAVTVTAEDEIGDPIEGAELSIDEIDTGGDDVTVDGLDGETATTDSDGVATFDGATFSGAIDATADVTVSAVDGAEDELTVTVGGFADGDGSAADPYVIEDWNHLDNVRLHLEKEFELGGNLDEETAGYGDVASEHANDGDGFEPISECGFDPWEDGCAGDGFSGTFDGQGYEIRELVIDREDSLAGVGLFNGTEGASIENVGLVDVDITGGVFNVGGLVGTSVESAITDSYVTGDVTGRNTVGGLVGWNFGEFDVADVEDSTIEDSYATSDVTGADSVGGLAGSNWGTVENSYATGNVTATGPGVWGDDPRAGGLLGTNVKSDGIIASYWDDQAATVIEEDEEQHGQGIGGQGTGAANVTALTTIEMTGVNAEDNMNLDFAETWGVVDEPEDGNVVSYPFLQNATQEPAPGLQTRYADGDGSADSPYEIENWHHLENVRENLDANFTLATDLDEETEGYGGDGESGVVLDESGELVDGAGFDPIGDGDEEFNGSFDGGDHTIEGLAIDRPEDSHVGLFGVVGSASTIEDVSLVDATVTGGETVGGLVGEHNGGEVRNVSVAGTVSGEGGLVGGLVGFHNTGGTLDDVSTAADVEGSDWVGGLVGESWGEITTATATGDVEGDGKVGGLVGSSNDDVTDAVATGVVSGTDDAVGGLVGQHWDGEISRSTAAGDVSGTEDVGGMAGQNRGGTITDSAATGDVDGGDLGTGGLVGWNDGVVSNSSAGGSGEGDDAVGGLVGENTGTVTTSYATGVVDEGETADSAGGLVGENSGEVDHSYWDSETTGQNESAGSPDESGLTTAEMTGLNATTNMDGFAFPNSEGTWHVTDAYPALAWEDTDPFFEVTIEETNSPVEAGETLTVTASVTNWADDGLQTVTLTDTGFTAAQQDATDVTLEIGQSGTVELDWTTDTGDGGTGGVTVASESHAATETVTVEATDEDSDSDPDPDPVPGPDPDPEEVEIEKTLDSHDVVERLQVAIRNSPVGHHFDLWLVGADVALDVGDVRVENLTFTALDGGDLSLVANASSEPLADTPDGEFPEPGMVGLAYLDVTTTFDAEDVTFTFRVEADALAELASAPETVVLHQYNETTGLWDARQTELVEEDDATGTLVYETTADSFSAWAVGAERPVLELVDADVGATTVTVGESVTVEATVANTGTLDGEYALDLLVDGVSVDGESVAVEAGATEQGTFTYTFTEAGEYTLEANEEFVADVTVEAEEAEPDDEPPEDDTDDADETDDVVDDTDDADDADDDGAGLGVVAAVLAILALAVFSVRRITGKTKT